MYKGLVVFISIWLTGCVSRGVISDDSLIAPVNNLYKRNFVVAVPTLVGNMICGTPFYFLHEVLLNPSESVPGIKTRKSEAIYHVPASLCGIATGTVFIPLSFLCEENDWDANIAVIEGDFLCKKKP